MSTELKPEVVNQDPPKMESPQPPVNIPAPTNPDIADLQLRVIADKERENRALKERLDNLEREKNAPAKPTEADQDREYFRSPSKVLRDILNETVAPLQSYVGELKARDVATDLKSRFKTDSRYASRWTKIEPVVDEMLRMHVAKGGSVNESIMNEAVVTAVGLIATNQINGVTFDEAPAPPTPKPAPNMVNPPHLAPSPAPLPTREVKSKVRDLTENERLLARARGWTAEQYLENLGESESGSPLVMTDYGQRKPKKKE